MVGTTNVYLGMFIIPNYMTKVDYKNLTNSKKQTTFQSSYLLRKLDKIKQSKLIKGEMGKTNIARQRGLVDDGIRLEENAIMQSRHTKGRGMMQLSPHSHFGPAPLSRFLFWLTSFDLFSCFCFCFCFCLCFCLCFLFLFLFLSAECNLWNRFYTLLGNKQTNTKQKVNYLSSHSLHHGK